VLGARRSDRVDGTVDGRPSRSQGSTSQIKPPRGRASRYTDLALAVLLGAAGFATYLLYPALNHGPNRIFLQTALDRAIPFVPVMVIPYVSLIPLIFVAAVVYAVGDLRRFQSYALAMTIALLVSYVVYATAQSYVIRPTITGDDWLSRTVRYVYSLDKPYNDFPSLHTSQSTIIAAFWLKAHRRTGMVVAAWCALIVASTLLIHQHYIADVGAGLLVAWLSVTSAEWAVHRFHRSTDRSRPGSAEFPTDPGN
jgi:membrane-associated phospholipid phosphatase